MRRSPLPVRAALSASALLLLACNALLHNEKGEFKDDTSSGGLSSSGQPSSSSSSSSGGSSGNSSSGGASSSGSAPTPCETVPGSAGLCKLVGVTDVLQVAATNAGLYLLHGNTDASLTYRGAGGGPEVELAREVKAVVSSDEQIFALVGRSFQQCDDRACAPVSAPNAERVDLLQGEELVDLLATASSGSVSGGGALAVIRTSEGTTLRLFPSLVSLTSAAPGTVVATNSTRVFQLSGDQLWRWDYEFQNQEHHAVRRPVEHPTLVANDTHAFVGNCDGAGQLCKLELAPAGDALPLRPIQGVVGRITHVYLAGPALFLTTHLGASYVRAGDDAGFVALPVDDAHSFTRSSEFLYFVAGSDEQVYRLSLAALLPTQ